MWPAEETAQAEQTEQTAQAEQAEQTEQTAQAEQAEQTEQTAQAEQAEQAEQTAQAGLSEAEHTFHVHPSLLELMPAVLLAAEDELGRE